MRIALLFAPLLLAGCGGDGSKFSEAERDEISDIASDAADQGSVEELRAQVDDLESRLDRAGVDE